MLLLPAAGCDGSSSRTQGAPQRRAVPVLTAVVTRADVPRALFAVGNVQPAATVSVRPQAGGLIVEAPVRPGQDVREGDVLFRLDPRPFEAAVSEVEARLARNRVLLKKAEEDMARFSRLVRQDAVSREQYDQAVTNAQSQRAAVNQDEALLVSARLQQEYATITAPVSGRVGEVLIDAGNVVTANGDPMLVIRTLSPAKVNFAVPERYLPEIMEYFTTRGMTVNALPEGDTRPPAEGKLTSINNTVDPATGTIRLEATFPNDDHRLWPGQFVRISLFLATVEGALTVPAPAVQEGVSGPFAYVVKDDATVEARIVAVSRVDENLLMVTEGLDEGDVVVTDGQINLSPGAAVSLRSSRDGGRDGGRDAGPGAGGEPETGHGKSAAR